MIGTKGVTQDGVVFHAGFPNAAEDAKFGSLSLDDLVVRHRESTFFWRLSTGIEELHWPKDSILVVDRALDPKVGSLVVAVTDEFIICRVTKNELRTLGGEVINGEVWGVVTYCIQPVRTGD
jgi:DNA polymerase V